MYIIVYYCTGYIRVQIIIYTYDQPVELCVGLSRGSHRYIYICTIILYLHAIMLIPIWLVGTIGI